MGLKVFHKIKPAGAKVTPATAVRAILVVLAAMAWVSLSACAPGAQSAAEVPARSQPEAAGPASGPSSPELAGEAAFAGKYMVVAANPIAAAIGREILRRGGTAVDAAVAVSMALNLVEPQSSGIGGGGFLLYRDGKTGEVTAWNGRESAPAAATPNMFLDSFGNPKGFYEAAVGGLAVGVPGLLKMLEAAHEKHGALPWAQLFTPAISLATFGFPVSQRLHDLIARDKYLKTFKEARDYFYHFDGSPRAAGEILTNLPFAEVLAQVADKGSVAFYEGDIARAMVSGVQNAPVNPGRLSLKDLARYQESEEAPLCRPYRAYQVCGAPPPTSGAVTLLQALGILEGFDLGREDPLSAGNVHLMAEALKLAFADRAKYLADPQFVHVPVEGLLESDYLRKRRALITPHKTMGKADPGTPEGAKDDAAPGKGQEPPSTTHMSIIDAQGNAVALTASIENAFGSRLMVQGFLLNNQLTDFSFIPQIAGTPIANAAAPEKRPRSSMAPTLVLKKDGTIRLIVGSPGGSNIIPYVLQTIVAVIDQDVPIHQAVALPHHANRNADMEVEEGTPLEEIEYELTRMGHRVARRAMTSGLHVIEVTGQGYLGAADPRREGVAMGD